MTKQAEAALSQTRQPSRRLHFIDAARGVALLAMAIYHFTWDLDYFGYVKPGLATSGGWAYFAHAIAGSFLFIAGYSLFMAHGRKWRLHSFIRRMAILIAAGLAITVVSYMMMPETVIYFGILQSIAAASLIGLLFVRLPAIVTLIVAAIVLALPHIVSFPALDPRYLAWIGLADHPPMSNDYVPLFPWLGAFLAGLAVARLTLDWLKRQPQFPRKSGVFCFLGRHSLIFYLVHQPVLFGLVWGVSLLAPPDIAPAYLSSCQTSCELTDSAAFCQSYCSCTLDTLQNEQLLEPLMKGLTGDGDRVALARIAMSCSIQKTE